MFSSIQENMDSRQPFFLMNASLSPKFRFGAESKSAAVQFSSSHAGQAGAALTNAEFLRQSCADMRLPVGPRDHVECPHRVTFDNFADSDPETFQNTIAAAYKQVFGNAHIMDYERCASLEAQLGDGRYCTRELFANLPKLSFTSLFHSVSPYRGIELSFKHLLGRPPLSQKEISESIALQADQGFDAFVDHIIDSAEYAEVFGNDTVPYVRSFTSASGMSMMNFVRIAALEQNFCSSDRSKGDDSLLRSNLASGAPMALQPPQLSNISKCRWPGQAENHPPNLKNSGEVSPWSAPRTWPAWSSMSVSRSWASMVLTAFRPCSSASDPYRSSARIKYLHKEV